MQYFVQDPNEKIEYQMNWTDGIPEGATIVTSTWSNTPFTASGTSIDGFFTVISLIGGVVGKRYKVENTITLSNGQTFTDSIFIYIEDK